MLLSKGEASRREASTREQTCVKDVAEEGADSK